jgi:hypothetical protein
MARVPVPVAPGQEVGGVQQQFRATPFQNISAPIEAFGGGTSSTLAIAAKGIGTLSDDLTAYNKEQDKVQLLKMEADTAAVNSKYQLKLKGLNGQVAIDAINGVGGGGGGASMSEAHAAELEAVKEKHKFRTEYGGIAAGITVQTQSTLFKAHAEGKKIDEEKAVNKALIASRIGAAAQSAASHAVGAVTSSPNADGTPSAAQNAFSVALHQSLQIAESSVRDPNVGSAAQAGITDPAAISEEVKAQQGVVITQSAVTMISNGNIVAAMDFVDKHTGTGGILAGTKAAAELNTKMLPYREMALGQKEFNTLLTTSGVGPDGKPSMSKMMETVDALRATEPDKFGRMNSALSNYAQLTASKDKEVVVGFVRRFLEPGADRAAIMADPNFALAYAMNPTAMAPFMVKDKGREVASGIDTAANQAQYEARNGGKKPNDALVTSIRGIATSDPQKFMQMFPTVEEAGKVIAPYMDYQNFEDFKVLHGQTKGKSTGTPYNLKGGLTALGFPAPANIIKQHSAQLAGHMYAARRSAESLGKPFGPAEEQKALAYATLRVMNEKTEEYEYLTAALNDDVDENAVHLKQTSSNFMNLALLFGKSKREVEEMYAGLDEKDQTVYGLAKAFNISNENITHQNFIAEESKLRSIATSNAMPYEFVIWASQVNAKGKNEREKFANTIAYYSDPRNGKARDEAYRAWTKSILGVQ